MTSPCLRLGTLVQVHTVKYPRKEMPRDMLRALRSVGMSSGTEQA